MTSSVRANPRILLPLAIVAAVLLAVAIGALAMANDGTPVPQGEVERLGGGPQQQAALADGSVTLGEYSEAFQNTLDCLANAGIPNTVSNDLQGVPRYSAGPFDSKAELDAAHPVMDACYIEHLRGIDVARAAAGH